ncbi:hypothetical protein [Paraburkholderia sp. BL10I2N1]|uniref:hypothetical protein n=1 Tax=Paraburkholderia sp. BL10I2N1 TaxID=1938796 RepID=UPI0010E4226E|nr:hypothetical protein [Paraburkholderia sp. BL10I2N1]TDN68245.1 hypothetical protein B0G77_1563 [Paraburkholderia sp. BL10I2N1]
MPFVFVHGVNNRQDTDYLREEKVRAAFLTEIVAPVVGIDPAHPVFAPYWGGAGVSFWRDLAVIPKGSEVETFGPDENELPPSLGIAVAEGAVQTGDTLHALARKHPDVAIDLLFDALIQDAKTDADILAVAKAYQLAQDRLADTGEPWLAQATKDDVLDQVLDVISPQQPTGKDETFGGAGFWARLEEGAKRLKLLGPDQLSHAIVGRSRRPLTRKLATFIGDAFRYLTEREDGAQPGPIASTVLQTLQQAAALSREKKEPLVVISHSFGGEIVYDILTHYAKDSDLEIDAWVTVGSQVGLFEEMSLLWSSPGRVDRAATPREAIASPTRAKRWLNIVDTNDVLGFLVLPVFTAAVPDTVHDFKYNTGYPVTGAHSGYFKWPSFYKRLAQRLEGQ